MKSWILAAPFVASLVSFSHAALAAPPEAAAHAAHGSVQKRSDHRAAWKNVADHAAIEPGREVTCATSCTLHLANGAELSLDGGAIAKLEPATFVVPAKDAKAVIAATIVLEQGHAGIRAPASSPVLVDLGSARALVSSGEAEAVVRDASHGSVANVSGDLRVRSTGMAGWSPVDAGRAASLVAGDKPKVRDTLAAPIWSASKLDNAGAPIALSVGGVPAPVGAAFSFDAAAASFRAVVSRDAAFSDVVDTIAMGEDARSFATAPLPVGSYFARVVAVDADGLSSRSSEVQTLRVIGATLPPSAIAAGARHMVLPPSAELTMLDTAGLELRSGGGFEAAPNGVGIGDGSADKRIVWLRLRGDKTSASPLVIERRGLKAEVELTPRLPHWPADPIVARVKIEDPSGREDAASIAPHFKVLMGIDEIPVKWTKDGDTWRARIAPRYIHENTVVRVIASDTNGVDIGRAFVEIDSKNESDAIAAN